MSKPTILLEFWTFIRTSKKWWLIPIGLFLAILGALFITAQGATLAPFIYTLF